MNFNRVISFKVLVLLALVSCAQSRLPPKASGLTHFCDDAQGAGQRSEEDSSWYGLFFRMSEQGDINGAYNLLLANGYKRDSAGSDYFVMEPVSVMQKDIGFYICYRFGQMQGDMSVKDLHKTLLDCYEASYHEGGYSVDCMERMVTLEFEYLKLVNPKPVKPYYRDISLFEKTLEKNSFSWRGQYLLSEVYYHNGLFDKWVAKCRMLLENGRYELSVYRKLIDYYRTRKADSAGYYQLEMNKKFPGHCFAEDLLIKAEKPDTASFQDCYKQVISGGSFNDSIRANVAMAKHLVWLGDIPGASDLVGKYYNSFDSVFPFIPIRIWEREQFFYLNARILLIKEKYKELSQFIAESTGYGEIISIKSESDLQKFIKQFWKPVGDRDSESDFAEYFEKNFKPYLRYFSF